MTKNDEPKWLDEISKDIIVKDHLGRNVVLDDVIDHLSCTPHKPLPKNLIDILNRWLKATSGHRIDKMNSGRPEAEWYPQAIKLIDNGFTRKEACERIRDEIPECRNLEIDSMMDMLKRHLNKRPKAQKKIDKIVREITDTRKNKLSD